MKIALIVPAYNEEEALPVFWQAVEPVLQKENGFRFEYIFVNDGSTDGTLPYLKDLSARNKYVKVISLSRNFGKEAALTAGLNEAVQADAAIVMDADLQDPPELIPTFLEKFKEGYDVVYGTRQNRQTDSWLKRISANAFISSTTLFPPAQCPKTPGIVA